jgi:hypothetical protein
MKFHLSQCNSLINHFQDPIADVLDDLCCQSHFPSSSHGMKSCYDIDMIRQSTTGVCSAEASFQNPSEKLQPCQEVHEDENNIDTVPEHVAHLVRIQKSRNMSFLP